MKLPSAGKQFDRAAAMDAAVLWTPAVKADLHESGYGVRVVDAVRYALIDGVGLKVWKEAGGQRRPTDRRLIGWTADR